MKVRLQIWLLVVGLHTCAAQTPAFKAWNKWCAKKDTTLLYPTGHNMIQIVCTGIKPGQLNVKSLDNALKIGVPEINGDTVSFMAMPYPKLGPRMRLAITDAKTKKVYSSVDWYAAQEPEPTAQLAGMPLDRLRHKDFVDNTAITVSFPNSDYCYPYRIKSYNFKTRKDGKDLVLPGKGKYLGLEIVQTIKQLPAGTFIEFTDIKATCPECAERALAPIKWWIKE